MNNIFKIVYFLITAFIIAIAYIFFENAIYVIILALVLIVSFIIVLINKKKIIIKASDYLLIYAFIAILLLLIGYSTIMNNYIFKYYMYRYVSDFIYPPYFICLIYYTILFLKGRKE